MAEMDEQLRERLAGIAQRVMDRPADWERLVAEEAARTDPWCWYCRLCGAGGAVSDGAGARAYRDEAARGHLRDAPCGRHAVTGWSEAGRLLHVWTYPADGQL